jgi:hypothetical protein
MSDRLNHSGVSDPPTTETAFSWEAGARQLIDLLMAVAQKVEGDIPEETRIHDLLKYCRLNDHADRL